MVGQVTFEDKIYKLLYDMEDDFDIQTKVTPENRERFIESVKTFIREGHDTRNGFMIELNNKLTKVIKIKL